MVKAENERLRRNAATGGGDGAGGLQKQLKEFTQNTQAELEKKVQVRLDPL